MRSALAAVALAALAAACDSGADAMRVVWQRDTVSAEFALPVHAVWCQNQGWLEVVGTRSDTGVGFALFTVDTTVTGQYPIVPVLERIDSTPPMAVMAVRWFSQDELLSFEGMEGEVMVEYTIEGLAGRFHARLRAPVGTDSLHLSGEFRATPVTRGGIECQPIESDSVGGDSAEVVD
jgi:hypothetical protein